MFSFGNVMNLRSIGVYIRLGVADLKCCFVDLSFHVVDLRFGVEDAQFCVLSHVVDIRLRVADLIFEAVDI